MNTPTRQPSASASRPSLDVYLLPRTDWHTVAALQQHLVYEVSGEPSRRGALVVVEHPPILTVGRLGSRRHLRWDEEEIQALGLEIQWTNRGGGVWLQCPGQLAIYPIMPLEPNTSLQVFRDRLYLVLLGVLREYEIPGERDRAATGVRVGDREIANVGFTMRRWVSFHGAYLNVNVPPDTFAGIQVNPRMTRRLPTDMLRERRLPLRMASVRESVVRHVVAEFGYSSYYLCQMPASIRARRPWNVVTKHH